MGMHKDIIQEMLEEARRQTSADAKAKHLWKSLEKHVACLADLDDSFKKLTVPAFDQLMIWATDQQAVKAKRGLKLVSQICSTLYDLWGQKKKNPGKKKKKKKKKKK